MGINPFLHLIWYKIAAIFAGFQSGRSEYERMNGFKCRNSTRIVTDKFLEDFLLAGYCSECQ
jgi:hypothetical protein